MITLAINKCKCGDEQMFHIDDSEECVIVGCGCTEYVEVCEFCEGDGMKRELDMETGTWVEVIGRECICQF